MKTYIIYYTEDKIFYLPYNLENRGKTGVRYSKNSIRLQKQILWVKSMLLMLYGANVIIDPIENMRMEHADLLRTMNNSLKEILRKKGY